MKKTFLTGILIMLSLAGFSDEVFLESFQPVTPDVLAKSMAVTASVRGYNSLWTNPAGLARETDKHLTVPDLQADLYIPVSEINPLMNLWRAGKLANIDPLDPAAADTVDFIQGLLINNGFGGRFILGSGLVANGLGMGGALDLDIYARGKTLMGTVADVNGVIGFSVGYAMPFSLGPAKLYTGVGVRPMFRFISQGPILDLLTAVTGGGMGAFIASNTAGIAPAFAIDVGLIAEYGDWSLGLSLRDSGSPVNFEEHPLTDIIGNPFNIPDGTPGTDTYFTPLTISGGVAWEPSLGPFEGVTEPLIELDVIVPLKGAVTQSWMTWFHLGGELTILDYLTVRTGINQGYVTGGIGVRLGFWETNLAIYTKELGIYSGEKPRSSITMETALRF